MTQKTVLRTGTTSAWAGSAVPGTSAVWLARAEEVGNLLGLDAVERDRANAARHAEVQLLKDSGLVALLGPVEFGGGGQSWDTALKVVRIVSRADGSIGQVLGYHYLWAWAVRLVGTEEQIGDVEELYTANNLGQRLTESGSVTIQDVRVGWASAAGFTNKVFEPLVYNSLNVPLIQQIFSNLYLGIAQGALEKVASCASTTTRAWPCGGDSKDRATEEFYIFAGYGDLQSKLWADEALINRVDAQISEILHAERSALTEQARGELAVRVAAAKVRIVEDGLETATRVFELTGARASSNKVGEYVLLNTLPEPSRYT